MQPLSLLFSLFLYSGEACIACKKPFGFQSINILKLLEIEEICVGIGYSFISKRKKIEAASLFIERC